MMLLFVDSGAVAVLLYRAGAVGLQQQLEILDLRGDLAAVVGVGNGDAPGIGLDGDDPRFHIPVVVHHILSCGKGLMLGQIHLVGVGDQRVARDACDGLVGLGHADVDDDELYLLIYSFLVLVKK